MTILWGDDPDRLPANRMGSIEPIAKTEGNVMADFCKQCSEEIFGEDFEDLKGLGDGTPLEPGMGWTALCEGCGPTVVDDNGICKSDGCLKGHN